MIPEARGKKYEYTERQIELEKQYQEVVTILNKSGYNAKYTRYWTWEEESNPGCIRLEIKDVQGKDTN